MLSNTFSQQKHEGKIKPKNFFAQGDELKCLTKKMSVRK